jgi:hypothetical protein
MADHFSHTFAELDAMPTLGQGQADDLKIREPDVRVWLGRGGTDAGQPYEHTVYVERPTEDGRSWEVVATYAAK